MPLRFHSSQARNHGIELVPTLTTALLEIVCTVFSQDEGGGTQEAGSQHSYKSRIDGLQLAIASLDFRKLEAPAV